ncbi:DUF72 domain-containing protein [Desulforhopalus sp. IMCC35007]|uniref:DUF72 domain-containing protein n=1 Tax=Desulforhopalus sp. IMCC35007 TaxID=2569543 RepID=UPI0010ADC722|nr:DUF72 domain-containing protein [Desulforhopalus sp. IMCC35007]TKB08231.1 DUF72 domain-containing protein [Desulforhopalus sp. IMCC35007]
MANSFHTSPPGVVELPGLQSASGLEQLCRISVGTCGYSYTEWVDNGFYPRGTRASDMLQLYSRCFSVVELNYTWYQMARADALSRMLENAPEHLFFAAKLTRTMTHDPASNWKEQLVAYREGIAPLKERLVAILIQLPPDFDRTVAHRKYLASLLGGLEGLPLAVEFRHVSWAVDAVFAELERREISLVAVDEPELPGLFPFLDVVTNPNLFYVRFHGRNRVGWRSGNMQKKFNYDYLGEELAEVRDRHLLKMASSSNRGVIFFNNHVRARAPENARRLVLMLARQGQVSECFHG